MDPPALLVGEAQRGLPVCHRVLVNLPLVSPLLSPEWPLNASPSSPLDPFAAALPLAFIPLSSSPPPGSLQTVRLAVQHARCVHAGWSAQIGMHSVSPALTCLPALLSY